MNAIIADDREDELSLRKDITQDDIAWYVRPFLLCVLVVDVNGRVSELTSGPNGVRL